MLSRGGGFQADVVLVERPSGAVVVKDFSGRGRLFAETLGRWLCAREVRAYRRLADVSVVPRFIGSVDRFAFAVEYRPGVMLTRSLRGRLPEGFMAELEDGVRAIHARGIVHLDMRHRSNVLAGDDGHPVVIDFASALRLPLGSRVGRWIARRLASIDLRALEKWRVRVEPVQAPPSRRASDGSATTASAGSRGASRPM